MSQVTASATAPGVGVIWSRLTVFSLGLYLLGFYWMPSGPRNAKGLPHEVLAAVLAVPLAVSVCMALWRGWRPRGIAPTAILVLVWVAASWWIRSDDPEVGAITVTLLAVQLGFFWCAAQLVERRSWYRMLAVVTAAAAVAALASLVAHEAGWSVRHLEGRYGAAWHTEHANLWGRYLGFAGLVALELWRRSRPGSSIRWVWGGVTVALFGCALLTGSRAVLFALLITVGVWLFSRWRRRQRGALLLLLLALAAIALIRIPGMIERSDAGRVFIYTELLRASADAPWLGVGPRQSDDVEFPKGSRYFPRGTQMPHSHSVLVGTRYHLGWIGVALLLWAVVAAWGGYLPGRFGDQLLLYGVLCLAVDGSRLVTSAHDSVWLLFWLPLARCAAVSRPARRPGDRRWLRPMLLVCAGCWVLAAWLALPRSFDPGQRPRQVESAVALAALHPRAAQADPVHLELKPEDVQGALGVHRAALTPLGRQAYRLRRVWTTVAFALAAGLLWCSLRSLRRLRLLALLALLTLPAALHLGLGGEPIGPQLLLVVVVLALARGAHARWRRRRPLLVAAAAALGWLAPAALAGLLPAILRVPEISPRRSFSRWMALGLALVPVASWLVGSRPTGMSWPIWLGPAVLWWAGAIWTLLVRSRDGAGPRQRAGSWVVWSLANVAIWSHVSVGTSWVDSGAYVDAWIAAVPALALWVALVLRRVGRSPLTGSLLSLGLPVLLLVVLLHEVEREWSWTHWAREAGARERRAGLELRGEVVGDSRAFEGELILVGPDEDELERLLFWSQIPALLVGSWPETVGSGSATAPSLLRKRVATPRWTTIDLPPDECSWRELEYWRLLEVSSGDADGPCRQPGRQ